MRQKEPVDLANAAPDKIPCIENGPIRFGKKSKIRLDDSTRRVLDAFWYERSNANAKLIEAINECNGDQKLQT